jgi:uncharacterized protein
VKIVFDTNVLFAAFVAHGTCAGLYEECLAGARMVVSPAILEELREKLVSKAKISAIEAREVVSAVSADAEVVPISPLAHPVCRDPDDDMVLATALAGKADAIVTGDQDLLVLGKFEGIPILSPRDCLAFLRERS